MINDCSLLSHQTVDKFQISKIMAGIYIHIPYCKTKCIYCDFYSITNLSRKDELVRAVLQEINERKGYLDEVVSTIYFGGGTPSVLKTVDINSILQVIYTNFDVDNDAEITLEANPDDLTLDYLKTLRNIGINRLSIGIQSFDDKQLRAINRRHTAEMALHSVKLAQKAGFENISIDLIFGLPSQNLESWKKQLNKAMTLNVQHISAYGLIYEENTPLWKQMKAGKIAPADDELSVEMYDYLMKTCAKNGFEQYEISNFSKPGFRSKHNSSYWTQTPYIGIGPSAHSYNIHSRQWNISSVENYCRNITNRKSYFEKEILSEKEKYNDLVMVSLRTIEGINLDTVRTQFGIKMHDYCIQLAAKYIENHKLHITNNFLRLTAEGILISDNIIVDLMYV